MTPAALLAPARWPYVAGLFAAAMLAAAHAFQAAGYAPCALCLRQREVYWAILAVCAMWTAVAVASADARRPSIAGALCAILAVGFLASFVVAGFHAGVEWKWWPGPATCASGGAEGLTTGDLGAVLSGARRVRPPACDAAPWVFAGLSMAGWNAALSIGMAALSVAAFVRSRRP